MSKPYFEIEASTLFSKSHIWQLNREYYLTKGISAWTKDNVPHQLTSNAQVGKTYAALIIGFLQDLAAKGKTKETVYILELGAGHGRLAFHVLKHLETLKQRQQVVLPPYCYVLSDIVPEDLEVWYKHTQFQTYFEQGLLDVTYFDAIKSTEIQLQYQQVKISSQDLQQPILAIANYFFDSIPTDLFLIKNRQVSTCSIALSSTENPKTTTPATLLKNLELTYQKKAVVAPFYEEQVFNEILEDYQTANLHTHLFFPEKSLQCLDNLRKLSHKGLMVLTMDKGFCDLQDLDRKQEPEIITHGSFSIWVNYHALGAFCKKHHGKTLFPSSSNFHLQIGCLLFLPNSASYTHTNAAYEQYVNDFGPDDFNSLKKFTYQHIANLNLQELIALLRLSSYDSTLFIRVLPRLKQLIRHITLKERTRFSETMHHTWNMYFSISEPFDLAYEMGGMFYDLGYYTDALQYFEHSNELFGQKADNLYNKALCYYQLREDVLFLETVKATKLAFPNFDRVAQLEQLDLAS